MKTLLAVLSLFAVLVVFDTPVVTDIWDFVKVSNPVLYLAEILNVPLL